MYFLSFAKLKFEQDFKALWSFCFSELELNMDVEFENLRTYDCCWCKLQESDKSQIFYWSSQTCSRIRQLIDWSMDGLLTMLKNLKTALFQTFSTWHRILSAFTALYWPSTAFYWPSTTKYQPVPPYNDPVPSWINHYRLILIQCHQVPTSRATYWPSTIMYQPVSPSSDPVPPSTEQYRLLLNQYHHISTSTAPYWPSTTKYQSIPTYTDPVPPSTNQYRLLLTQYHQVPTSTASHWPSTTKYQPVPPSTDPVPSYINQYRFILTQYHQVSTSTNLYCFSLGTTDSCTVYHGSCFYLFLLDAGAGIFLSWPPAAPLDEIQGSPHLRLTICFQSIEVTLTDIFTQMFLFSL